MFRNLKSWSVLSAITMIAIGLVLMIFPGVSLNVVCTVMGIAFIAWGAIRILSYFMLSIEEFMYRSDMIAGLLFILGGILMLARQNIVLDIIPILLGLVIVISGITKLQNAVIAKRIGYGGATLYMILALISIVFGFVIMFFLSGTLAAKTLFVLIGAGLVYSGGSDLYVTLFISNKYNKFMKEFEKGMHDRVIDAESEDK